MKKAKKKSVKKSKGLLWWMSEDKSGKKVKKSKKPNGIGIIDLPAGNDPYEQDFPDDIWYGSY